jgi:hypothetical protein
MTDHTLGSMLVRTVRAGIILASHLLLAAITLGAIWLMERYITWLWGESEPRLFGAIPIKYFFDVMDAGVLVTFVALAVADIARSLRAGQL